MSTTPDYNAEDDPDRALIARHERSVAEARAWATENGREVASQKTLARADAWIARGIELAASKGGKGSKARAPKVVEDPWAASTYTSHPTPSAVGPVSALFDAIDVSDGGSNGMLDFLNEFADGNTLGEQANPVHALGAELAAQDNPPAHEITLDDLDLMAPSAGQLSGSTGDQHDERSTSPGDDS